MELKEALQSFFEKHLKSALSSFCSYVVDLWFDPESDSLNADSFLVIELNPFHIGAGAGLFTWKDDRELFLHGPLELRLAQELPENALEILPPPWRRYVLSLLSNDDGDKSRKKERCFLM